MSINNIQKIARDNRTITLFDERVLAIVVLVQILSFLFLGFDFYYQLAVLISVSQFTLLFFNIGRIIPIRQLVGTTFSLNYLLVPVFMFRGLNEHIAESYRMVGSPDTYFSYAIPAMLMLLLGLNLFRSNDSIMNVDKIRSIAVNSPRLPFYLMMVGLMSNFIAPFLPSEISLIFSCMSYFRFAGFFLSLFNGKSVNYMYLFLSYGLLVIVSLISSLFNDLLNMLFFLGFILAIRYKASNKVKLMGIGAVVLLVIFIQVIKAPLRERVSGDLQDITKLDEAITEGSAESGAKSGLDKIADVLMRLDQGWVTSRTIQYQSGGGFELQHGKHSLIVLESSVFPRVLVPDKLAVGDPQEFNKYSGHFVDAGTSIGLGLLTDGYIDYGFNGIFIVFAFGLIINIFIKIYNKMDAKYPLIKVFLPIGFFYAVRPDTDTQSALGALFKMTFVLWLTMIYINNNAIKFRGKVPSIT